MGGGGDAEPQVGGREGAGVPRARNGTAVGEVAMRGAACGKKTPASTVMTMGKRITAVWDTGRGAYSIRMARSCLVVRHRINGG